AVIPPITAPPVNPARVIHVIPPPVTTVKWKPKESRTVIETVPVQAAWTIIMPIPESALIMIIVMVRDGLHPLARDNVAGDGGIAREGHASRRENRGTAPD